MKETARSHPQLLRVKNITVRGLFGRFNHTVELNLIEQVTILHGPNGVGKTVLLRMVDWLLGGHVFRLLKIPFEELKVGFTDDTYISVTRDGQQRVEVKWHNEVYVLPAPPGMSAAKIEVLLEEGDARLVSYGSSFRIERRPGFDSLGAEASNTYPGRGGSGGRAQLPDWLVQISEQVRCHLIETQRLLRLGTVEEPRSSHKPAAAHTVQHDADDLARRIRETTALYGRESQALDQSYPQRVLAKKGDALTTEELKQRLQGLDSKQTALKDLGLLDRTATSPFDPAALDNLDSTERRAMTLYVGDTEAKLSVLDDLARRIKLLQNNLNQKLRHKRIVIDREKGFIAQDDRNESLDLDALSSGEQHELVLHYALLFRVPSNTLVLIDEPELSLHVTWQKRFLPDLLEIVKTTGFDVLLATHSPFIVGDRADLMMPLDDEAP